MTETNTGSAQNRGRTNIQKASLAYGVVFLLVGVMGFIPGITTNYEPLAGAGHHSEALLLGIFQVSILHNVVHLLYGVAGLLLARSAGGARAFMLWGGVVYLVLWIYGLVIDGESAANFVPLNNADNWLHLFLGVTMIGLALLLTRSRDRAARTA